MKARRRMRRQTRYRVLLALGLAACNAPEVLRPDAAYNPTALTAGLLYRWEIGRTIRVWTVASPTAVGFDLGLAVREGMAQWNAVPQFGEFVLTSATSLADADVVVFDRSSAVPLDPGTCTYDPRNSAGYTYFCDGNGAPRRAEHLPIAGGGVSSATVLVRVDRGRVADQAAYRAVIAHELGHVLGIGAHSDVAADLMFGLPTTGVPSARDRATLRFVLGQPAGLTL